MRQIINKLFCAACLAGCLLTNTSCNDYLNTEPKNTMSTSTFYSTDAQVDQALIGVYSTLKPIAEYYLKLSEIRSDNMWVTTGSTKPEDVVLVGQFSANAEAIILGAWQDYFTIVASANKLIDEIDNAKLNNESIREQYKAEARFLRALAYFDLVRLFGNVPMATHALTVDEAFATKQSSAETIYDEVIVPDLQYAVEHLETTPIDYLGAVQSYRVSNVAAKAMLGRVYLTMAGFPLYKDTKGQAKTLLKDVIDYASAKNLYWAATAAEWDQMWLSDNDNKYFIFEIQYASLVGLGNTYTPYSVAKPKAAWCSEKLVSNEASITAEKTLLEHFAEVDDAGNYKDKRTLGTIDGDDADKKFFVKFYENIKKRDRLMGDGLAFNGALSDRTCWPQNFPLIRLEDVMLMYAEVAGKAEGEAYVNKIRQRAGLDAIDASAMTEDEFLVAVDNERRYELAGEGIRWHDLVRHNTYVQNLQNMFVYNDNTSDQRYAAMAGNVKATNYIYAIPLQQIHVRDGLYTQNPGY